MIPKDNRINLKQKERKKGAWRERGGAEGLELVPKH